MYNGEVNLGSAFGPGPVEEENPELEAVQAACDALPPETGGRIKEMFTSNGLTMADLDVKSVMDLARLHPTLQQKVLQHLESERVFLCNSRSKSRFLISTCERAKQGALDVRGFGAIDPWKSHLSAIAVERPKTIELMKEWEYMERVGHSAVVTFSIDCSCCESLREMGENVEMSFPMENSVWDIKSKLVDLGCTLSLGKIKLKLDSKKNLPWQGMPENWQHIGFLKEKYSFGHYNMPPGPTIKLTLVSKVRGGRNRRKDLSQCTALPTTRAPLLAQQKAITINPMMAQMIANMTKVMQAKAAGALPPQPGTAPSA
ncbi:unnamed protein product [Amoebophrya sp. A25]|nr:unnamed protein product [Amoebophrya sp. A25]|eukprot:GSA25T00002136001.1